jgi:hypothetical protein
MDEEYSPLPWRLEQRDDGTMGTVMRVLGAGGDLDVVCDNEPYYPQAVSEANMRLIIAAVNALTEIDKIAVAHKRGAIGLVQKIVRAALNGR